MIRTDTVPRITPAHAGSTVRHLPKCFARGDHPRTRGKHQPAYTIHAPLPGSPPHTREALDFALPNEKLIRITPAHAGSTQNFPQRSLLKQDHPRTRGKHRTPFAVCRQLTGSPPHTREALSNRLSYIYGHGITPAHAGSTRLPEKRYRPDWDHPRTRGKHRFAGSRETLRGGSPPHTREAHGN